MNGIIDCRDNESSNKDIDESTIMDDSSSSSTIPHDNESKAREEYDREQSSIVTTMASSRGARRCSPTPDDDARGSTNGLSSYDFDRRASVDAARDEGNSAEPSLHDDNGDERIPPARFASGMPVSNDPRVLDARRKLWRAIDDALASYSREIAAIEADVAV